MGHTSGHFVPASINTNQYDPLQGPAISMCNICQCSVGTSHIYNGCAVRPQHQYRATRRKPYNVPLKLSHLRDLSAAIVLPPISSSLGL
ncbi:hypothetical protein GJ496_008915 [Pomphorhynchus laevis]|nr:hypothetical protein GJ496_008915 [Pomphorhynchus laevis]